MPGPLPNPNRIRRNLPRIPTMELPVSGLRESAPRLPSWVKLGASGKAWWRWAWATPQAAGWSSGDLPVLARRASLEDDLAALDSCEGLDLSEVAEAKAEEVRTIIRRLAGLCTGRIGVMKEARELDDRLGLTPKGLAALHWKIIPDPHPEEPEGGDGEKAEAAPVTSLSSRRGRLSNAS